MKQENKKTRLQEVVAVVNNKGGVGKTTTVQSLAAAIVRLHPEMRVLLIDLDPQCHLSLLHGWNSLHKTSGRTVYDAMRKGEALPVYETTKKGVFIVPGATEMQEVDTDLFRQMNPKMVLAKCFKERLENHTAENLHVLWRDFDYVLIDCPPALSQSTYNAMCVATGLLIPVEMAGLAVNGLGNIIVALKNVKRELNPLLELTGIVPTKVSRKLKIARQFRDYLRKEYGDVVTETTVRNSTRVNEAQTLMKDIYEYRNQSAVSDEYESLAREVFFNS